MDYKDYYKIMGVARDASQEDIKRAYRKLARKYHPDVSKEAGAEEKFKELQEANEVLKDAEKRAAYDQLGSRWKEGQEFRPPPDWGKGFEFSRDTGGGADFSDFFSSLFGQRHFGGGGGDFRAGGFGMEGQDQTAKIEIDLEDAYRGGVRTIELNSQSTGRGPANARTPNTRTLRVTIPPGVTEGQQIRLAGQGSGGMGGGRAGDLYLELNFKPHPLYQANGRDLTLTLPIAPWEAALGASVQVPTMGGPVEMRIPAGAKSGQKLRLKGRGLPGNGDAGDQFIILKIVLPPAVTPRARELYEEMRRDLPFDPRAELQSRT